MASMLKATWFRCLCISLLVTMLYEMAVPGLCMSQNARRNLTRVKPGDSVHIYVYDGMAPTETNRFISTFHDVDLVVDGFGEVQLFSLGKLRVVGLTGDEIASLLREKLKPFAKNPIVVAIPLIRVTLRGAFKQPGMYRYSVDTTFWDMIREAGGLEDMEIEDIALLRNQVEMSKGFMDALYKASSLYELGIQSGDEFFAKPKRKIPITTIMSYTNFTLSVVLIALTIRYGRRLY